MPQLLNDVIDTLRKCGIDAHRGAFVGGPGVVIPVNYDLALHAIAGKLFWEVEFWNDDGTQALLVDMLEPEVPADTYGAEPIAVYIVRCLMRAGRGNRVPHPYVKR